MTPERIEEIRKCYEKYDETEKLSPNSAARHVRELLAELDRRAEVSRVFMEALETK